MTNQQIAVWDDDAGTVREVTPAEAVAGLLRYARHLGAGTPAAGIATRRALRLAHEHGLRIGGQR
jgi:hypothetical protein